MMQDRIPVSLQRAANLSCSLVLAVVSSLDLIQDFIFMILRPFSYQIQEILACFAGPSKCFQNCGSGEFYELLLPSCGT